MNPKMQKKISVDIAVKYGYKNIQFSRKAGGISSHNYVIEASSKPYILKVYRSTNETVVKTIEDITLFLFNNSQPVVKPIINNDKAYHFCIDKKIIGLYPLAKGKVLHQQELSDISLISTARALASFHSLGASCKLSLNTKKHTLLSIKVITNKSILLIEKINRNSLGPEIDKLAVKLIKIKLEILQSLIVTTNFTEFLKCHDLIHGDFHNENILFDDDNKLAYILDFEEVHFGHGIEDVINFIQFACCNTGYDTENLAKARCFFEEYSSIRPVTLKEIEFGVHFNLFKMASSYFLEEVLYTKKDLFIVNLLQRDFDRINYFKNHIQSFIDNLSQCLPTPTLQQ